MDEPDAYEIDEMDEAVIGIFEPGSFFERIMDWAKFSKVLLYLFLGWVMMFALTIVIMIPLIGVIGLWGILENPWAFLILTFAEFGFIIPIVYYLKKEGLPLRSVGLKKLTSVTDIGLGLIVGFAMLGANLVISYFMSLIIPELGEAELGFEPPEGATAQLIWVSAWTIAMFAVVGLSEEIAFRGFLQRRMEMYYRDKGNHNFKLYALILTSFIFAAIHLDPIGLGTRFVLGMFMGYLAQRRKYSIIGPTVAHGVNNSAVVIFALLGW